MKGRRKMGRSRVWVSRWIAAAALLGVLVSTSGCELDRKELNYQQVLQEFYLTELAMLKALESAFFTLGQEYYILELEYRRLGQNELADGTLRKAEIYHQQYREFQERITNLELRQVRVRRGESPLWTGQIPGASPTQGAPAADLATSPVPPVPAAQPQTAPRVSPSTGRSSPIFPISSDQAPRPEPPRRPPPESA